MRELSLPNFLARSHAQCRDTPEPLLTEEYLETFALTQCFETRELQLYALKLLCVLLPPVNRHCLLQLLGFLSLVADRCVCFTGVRIGVRQP